MRREIADKALAHDYFLANIEAKNISSDGGRFQLLSDAIQRSLGTVYKAVVLDIDGTLTSSVEETEKSLVETIAMHVESGVPFAVVTGRGRGGAAEYVESRLLPVVPEGSRDLVQVFCHHAGYVRLLEDFEDGGDEWTSLQTSEDHKLADQTIEGVASKLDELGLNWTQEPFSIRIRDVNSQLLDKVSRIARSDGLQVARGRYDEKTVYDLRVLSKEKAVAEYSKRIGIQSSRILRVGDAGAIGEADFEMLNEPSGFSVGTCNEEEDRCFVVGDHDGALIGGAAATSKLLGDVVLAPPIAIRVQRHDKQAMREFYNFEMKARTRARKEWRRLEWQFALTASRLCRDSGTGESESFIREVYDPRSGSIRLRDEETTLISESYGALAGFFDVPLLAGQEVPGRNYSRAMYSDSSILLRGKYYYGTMRHDSPEKASLSIQAFIDESLESLHDLGQALSFVQRPQTLVDFKLLLGGLDHRVAA